MAQAKARRNFKPNQPVTSHNVTITVGISQDGWAKIVLPGLWALVTQNRGVDPASTDRRGAAV